MGILFAVGALFAWGIGDFLIQRSARKLGSWISLFYITAFASIVLLPFVYRDIAALFSTQKNIFFLLLASFVTLFAAFFDFEALRKGKISVIEPVYALEVPITAIFGIVILGEFLTLTQTLFTILLILGIMLVSIKSFRTITSTWFEAGVLYAVIATVAMGAVNFLFGVGARLTNPLLINWFTSFFVAATAFSYLASHARLHEIKDYWRQNRKLIISVSAIDNLAWICFAYSALYIPIAISTGISESYIALAAGLGLIFNKEKLKSHQFLGIGLAVAGVILLSFVTDR
jgi:transporter family protein